LLSIKAQIICNHFSEETIVKISGADQLSDSDKQLVPQALALLKSESAKNFRIEVTSDSMIYQDEQQEKQNRVEFLTAVSQFIQTAMPVGQAAPELVPLFMEMLKFGVTAFKAGKQMEGLIDETADKFREQAKMQEGQPQPPSPEVQKMQMQAQLETQKMQSQMQLEQQKMQANIEMERAKQEYQSQEAQVRMQMEMQRNASEREMEMKMAQMKMMTERNTQLLLAYVNNGAKVEVAQISAGVNGGEGLPQAYDLDEDMAKAMEHPLQPIANAIQQGNAQTADMIAQLAENINQNSNRPKQVIRGADGKIIGVQ
jgi:hypothetical protein